VTRLSVKIMAHKKREKFIPHLVEQLGLTEDDVIWDTKQDRWDTGRRAWEAVDQTAEWGCVIQDDALVARDFIAGMQNGLSRLTTNTVVSPYVGTRRPMAHRVEAAVRTAVANDASWIKMPSLNWGVAIIIPTRIINGMLPWCDRQKYPNYDRRIGRYCIDVERMPTICTWPSLVDHREVPSLVGHGGGRTAHKFLGESGSALDVNWDGPIVSMTRTTTSAHRAVMNRGPRGLEIPSFNPTSVEGRASARQLRVARRIGNSGQVDQPPVRPGS
jgi:hypothetical protein